MASRLVDALETRLGARLLQRSTCHQSLTEIGELYLARVERILGAIDEIDGRVVAMGSKPEGALRIAAPVAFASQLSALLDRFVNRFPDVRPTVTLTDAHVDLTSEDIDVAFLTDGMPVTGAHALHTLAAYESVRVAAPTYVDAHGGAAASGDWPDITAVRLDLPANGDDDAVAFRPDTAPGGSWVSAISRWHGGWLWPAWAPRCCPRISSTPIWWPARWCASRRFARSRPSR